MRKKALIFLLFFLMPFSFTFSASKKVCLRLPVRIIEEEGQAFRFSQDNLRLFVNDKQREIVNLIKRKRSLSKPSDLGRNFVLSFHTAKIGKQIENATSFFITEILNSNDSLVVSTPIQVYRLPVSRNKEKMISDVMRLLRRDCQIYQKNRNSPEKNLDDQINKLKTSLSEISFDPSGISLYKATNQFLLSFPKNFSYFRKLFLMPNISKYQEIKDILAERHGERWWIHFQHRENLKIVQKAKEAMDHVNTYISILARNNQALARAMKSHLYYFERQLILSDFFPFSNLLEILLSRNISFNTVFWGNLESGDTSTPIKQSAELEGLFSEISRHTGGKTVVTNEPEMGLKNIQDHADHFYEVNFDFNGKMEEKKIQILLADSNRKLSYKNEFSKDELEYWIDVLSEKSVEIGDFSIKKNKVIFSVKSFKQEKEKKYGLLKVRMSLFDKHNLNVFQTENILRASKNKMTISISLPEEHHGPFKLSIIVFDLLANTSVSRDHLFTLN